MFTLTSPGTSQERSISSPSQAGSFFDNFSILTILTPTFERIHITQRARVRKVEFDDIVALVQRRAGIATVTGLHVERHARAGRRRGANARSKWGGGRTDGGHHYIWRKFRSSRYIWDE